MTGADLREAGLDRAGLVGADPRGADVRCADVRGANLARALFLTPPQVPPAIGDGATRLPAALEPAAHWLPSS